MDTGRQIFRFKPGMRFFDFDDISFVVDTAGANLYNLGMSSALISRNLNGQNDLAKIADVVQTRYQVNTAEAEKAVEKCVRMLAASGLIEEVC